MKKQVILLEGDGIGPEIAAATLEILHAAGAEIEWEVHRAGLPALEKDGDVLPEPVLEAIRRCGVALKGPITTPIGRASGSGGTPSFKSVNVRMRQALDLFANVRPLQTIPGVATRYQGVNFVLIRENTEGLYAGLETEFTPDVCVSFKVATRSACERIAEFAFHYARTHGWKKVTGVHKANIMKLTDGLALECYRAAAKRYPELEYEERIVDATAMELVMAPERFQVMVTENLYGDILSDLGAGLIGGLGLAPSANYGTKAAVFEAIHGSAPDIAGKGVANPTALLLSAVEMLRYIGQSGPAERINQAVLQAYQSGTSLTRDVGGKGTTKEFTQRVIDLL